MFCKISPVITAAPQKKKHRNMSQKNLVLCIYLKMKIWIQGFGRTVMLQRQLGGLVVRTLTSSAVGPGFDSQPGILYEQHPSRPVSHM